MVEYIKEMKFSSLFLLACGAVVREKEALAGLEEVTKRYAFRLAAMLANRPFRLQVTDAFAFGAEGLFSHYPALWMIAYADQVIIGGQPSEDSISNLLYTSGVGTHTSIAHLNKQPGDGEVAVCQYIWEHKSQRPNTFSYPVTCPICHHIYPWQKVPSQPAAMGSPFVLKCKTVLGNGRRCTGTWNIPACPDSSVVESPYIGTWRKM